MPTQPDSNGVYTLGIPTAVLHSTLPGSGSIQSVQYWRQVSSDSNPLGITHARLFGLSGSLPGKGVQRPLRKAAALEIAFPLRGNSERRYFCLNWRLTGRATLQAVVDARQRLQRCPLINFGRDARKRNALDSLFGSKTGYITSGQRSCFLDRQQNDIVLQTEGTGSSGATFSGL